MTQFGVAIFALALTVAGAAFAQTGPFSSFQQSSDAPLEVTADQLGLNAERQTAIFSGNVSATQGALRITAAQMEVFNTDAGIARVIATGGVFFASETETAEANRADYDVAGGTLTMTGDVLVTQGSSAIGADQVVIDLNEGTGSFSGNVRSILVRPE